MSFPLKLREARHNKGLTQQQIADKMGITKTTYCGYENGRREPDVEKIKKLACILELSCDELLEIDYRDKNYVSPVEMTGIKKYRTLDEYGTKAVDAVLDIEYERCLYNEKTENIESLKYHNIKYFDIPASAGLGEWLDSDNYVYISIPDIPEYSLADFAIRVQGHSMEPDYMDGDIVLVHSQDAINDGDVGIFWVDGESYIKELRKGSLYPRNKEYQPMTLRGKEYRCFGKVIAKLHKD